MAEKSISFRTALQSNVTDLLDKAGLQCVKTNRLVTSLVSTMAAYTEEGVSLTPAVFIASSADRIARISGAGGHIELGAGADLEAAGPDVLKVAAPLSTGMWHIYVETNSAKGTCAFGVFSGSADPSALSVEETLLGDFDPDFPVVQIAQISKNKVSVRTSYGDTTQFRFNDDADQDELSTDQDFLNIAQAALSEYTDGDKPPVEFFARLIRQAVTRSHGTMIAVVDTDEESYPEALGDATILGTPIDLVAVHRTHFDEDKTASTMSALQGVTDLFHGMVNCDGITVLDAKGRIRAYRAFVPSGDEVPDAKGGARTRAYAKLKTMVGTEIVGALFRSQDGRTETKVK